MQILNSFDDLKDDKSRDSLAEQTQILLSLKQSPSVAVLKDKVIVIVSAAELVEADDVLVIWLPQIVYFIN